MFVLRLEDVLRHGGLLQWRGPEALVLGDAIHLKRVQGSTGPMDAFPVLLARRGEDIVLTSRPFTESEERALREAVRAWGLGVVASFDYGRDGVVLVRAELTTLSASAKKRHQARPCEASVA